MRPLDFIAENEIRLLHRGAEFFPELIKAIDAALSHIRLETYIFRLDETGQQVCDALVRAAHRGVRVFVITDWVGTGRHECGRLRQTFLAHGIAHRNFNPWFRRGPARMHRKMCAIDGELAFLGGLNIVDDMRDDARPERRLPAPRWDFAIATRGGLVAAIEREMEEQWARLGHLPLIERLERLRRRPRTSAHTTPALAALVVRDNFRNRRTIQRALLHALGHARHAAWLVTPYFAPGRKLRAALETAAQRGVKVTLLLGAGQFRMQDAVAHSYYPKLMRAGIEIYEYRKTQLHGKVAVIDDEWATVGSSNADGLSLFVNQEANVVVRDHAFAGSLREYIEAGVVEATRVHLADLESRPWMTRLWDGMAFLLYRGVLRLITLGKLD